MRINADLPEVTVRGEEGFPALWPMSADVKAALVVIACLVGIVGDAVWFVRFMGI